MLPWQRIAVMFQVDPIALFPLWIMLFCVNVVFPACRSAGLNF